MNGDQWSAVEWHTIGAYRVSFDRRADASRFIILAAPGVVVGKGLIELDHVQFDEIVSTGVALVGALMYERWEAMRETLRGES